MTTPTKTTATRATSKRTPVPVPAGPTNSPALDTLTGSPDRAGALPRFLDLDDLVPHPANPRRDLGDLTELADSIRAHGVRQNLLVVPDPGIRDPESGQPNRYRIVIGHRRAAAARLAGETAVPAVVDLDLDAAGQLELMLLENIQRTDLTPVEEADGYQGLLDLGLDTATIARRTGRSAKTVRSRLRLAALPEAARAAVHEHRATLEDAAKIEAFTDPEMAGRLAAALGTTDFRWQLERAERDRTLDAAFVKCAAALAVLRIEVVFVERSDPGWTHVGVFGPETYGTSMKATALKELPEGTVASPAPNNQRMWSLYSPVDAAAPAAETAAAARERAKEEAAAAADAPDTEVIQTASRLRGEFLAGILSGTRPLTRAQQTQVITWVARYVALTGYFGGENESLVGQWVALSGWDGNLTSWVDSVIPAYPFLAVAAAQFEDRPDDHQVTNYGAIRGLRCYRAGWHREAEIVAWYGLLEQLGYAVSDVERAALTPPDAEVA